MIRVAAPEKPECERFSGVQEKYATRGSCGDRQGAEECQEIPRSGRLPGARIESSLVCMTKHRKDSTSVVVEI